MRLPEGKALQQTDGVMRSMEQQVMAYPEVRSVFSSVGGSNKNQFARESKEENVAQLYVVMKDKQDKAAEARVIDRIRPMLQQFPEVAFTFSRPTLFSVKTPVEVEIYAYDLDTQRKAADDVAAAPAAHSRLERYSHQHGVRQSGDPGAIRSRETRAHGPGRRHGLECHSQQSTRRCRDALPRGRQADRDSGARR